MNEIKYEYFKYKYTGKIAIDNYGYKIWLGYYKLYLE